MFAGDGTISVTHSGIEMGQGINTKVGLQAVNILQTVTEYYGCSTLFVNKFKTLSGYLAINIYVAM